MVNADSGRRALILVRRLVGMLPWHFSALIHDDGLLMKSRKSLQARKPPKMARGTRSRRRLPMRKVHEDDIFESIKVALQRGMVEQNS